jgi:NAD(P)-dependent dehydrogenase (short-subunit alcohol dehydrogenase family)
MAGKRSVVVTGASTGIGWAIAKVLIQRGFRVFGSVRKKADAERLQEELGSSFVPLTMDVTDEAAVRKAAAGVQEELEGATLAGLVNNAGIAVSGPLLHLPADEYRRQLEVNMVGPMIVTQAFAPLLGADRSREGKPGRIVNISSGAGKVGYPFLGAYCASKHGLEGFSEALRRELMLYGIDVVIVGPGPVATPIWDKAEETGWSAYAATDYGPIFGRFSKYFIQSGRRGFPPERIGEVVHTALTTARPRVRYAVMPQRLKNWTIPGLLPRRLLDRLIGKQIGLIPGKKP